MTTSLDLTPLKTKLQSAGQSQVLHFWDTLSPASQLQLADQLHSQDLSQLNKLASDYILHRKPAHVPANIQPVAALPNHPGPEQRALYEQAATRGHDLLKSGKIAAFLVAGGQGTRLGYDGPKGEFPVTPIKNKPLFQVFSEVLLAHGKVAGKTIPWYIMTSDANDARTRAFFKQHNYFGYPAADIFFFQQGMMPAFDLTGKLLLGARDSLALSPDGHGGSLTALHRSGALDDMAKRGVEHLSYFQVDNPMVHIIDPLFLGLHDLTGSEMSSKTISKAGPLEKVGNFCQADGVVQVIEYSDLPDTLAKQTNPDGSLRYNAGSIAIHALRVSFIQRLTSSGHLDLPWHRADKKVPFVDPSGTLIKPQSNNAVKLEQFVFDAIPLAKNPLVYTTDRAEEFSPVKNADGTDSPATCRRDQSARFARWLAAVGVAVPMKDGQPDCTIEISPLYAANPAQLASRSPKLQIAAGAAVYLE